MCVSIERLNSIAYSIIQERRKSELAKQIAPLPETEADVPDPCDVSSFVKYDLVSLYLSRQDEGNPLSDEQLRDIILNFILAGRDTTAQVR